MEWIMEESRRAGQPSHIQHALNSGEKDVVVKEAERTFTYHMDGYCAETSTVYEYHSCFLRMQKVLPRPQHENAKDQPERR